MLSASEGLRPLTRGSGPHWGHSPQTPIIGLHSSTRHELAPQMFTPNSTYGKKDSGKVYTVVEDLCVEYTMCWIAVANS